MVNLIDNNIKNNFYLALEAFNKAKKADLINEKRPQNHEKGTILQTGYF